MVGGTNGSNYLASVEVYDPVRNHWQPIASIASGPRCSLALGTLGNDVYAIGGGNGKVQGLAEILLPQ